jgi:hypothetical protein
MSAETPEAKALVLRLQNEAKMTPQDISAALASRVSSRTIYRWAKGESAPQQSSDFKALEALVSERCP